MSISETANKNHEELFPNHKSALKITDPELIEVFDNFAFDKEPGHLCRELLTFEVDFSRSTPTSQRLGHRSDGVVFQRNMSQVVCHVRGEIFVG